MYMIAFLFHPGEYDETFHNLNAQIDQVALETPGYIGQESWKSADGTKVNATYYWDNLENLQAFSRDPIHLEAKRQYARWYNGYQIVISEVIRSFGDGRYDHFTPNQRHSNPSI
jgi:heme-degrading monooxygenase HmoA